MDINRVMEYGIANAAQSVFRFYMGNKRGRKFLAKILPSLKISADKRQVNEKKGLHIPPLLIASISSACNLRCKGCYARAEGGCVTGAEQKELNAKQWENVFCQASELGVSFLLLAGGEPLLRRDVLERAARFENMVFPVFTNGMLLSDSYIDLLDGHRNLIPVLSIEGSQTQTDNRRGKGTAKQLEVVMEKLQKRKILFGVSVTVTRENLTLVCSRCFVDELEKKGCGLVFLVEYVPVQKATENLALSAEEQELLCRRAETLKAEFPGMVVLSFPGDEEKLGGCLAAGRGFFHINPAGGAEPCPFSPHSKISLKDHSIVQVLESAFFRDVRALSHQIGAEHKGGCALFSHKEKVEKIYR